MRFGKIAAIAAAAMIMTIVPAAGALADNVIYTVVFDGVERENEYVTADSAKAEALPAFNFLPDYTLPHIDGYVFKDYTLEGTTYTLTYVKNAETLGTWFTRNNVSDPSLSVKDMNFLGAHDAFTGKISSVGDVAAAITGDSGSQWALYLGGTVKSISQTQSAGTYDLLNAGVRYFDVRLTISDTTETYNKKSYPGTAGEFYTAHGLLAQPLKTVLYTIRDFCAENPGEVIVLDFQSLFNALDSTGTQGASTSQNWTDLYNVLVSCGVGEYMVDATVSPSGQTWAKMTDNGEHAAVVCFGQSGSQNTQSAHFISASSRRAAGGGDGYLYSYYESTPATYEALLTAIQTQVDNLTAVWPYRIMQAMYEGSNILSSAADSNPKLIEEDEFEEWLKKLPTVMVNDAVVGTEEYIKLFAEINRDGYDKAYSASSNGVTISTAAGEGANAPLSSVFNVESEAVELPGYSSAVRYDVSFLQYSSSKADAAGEVTLEFPLLPMAEGEYNVLLDGDGNVIATAADGNTIGAKVSALGEYTVAAASLFTATAKRSGEKIIVTVQGASQLVIAASYDAEGTLLSAAFAANGTAELPSEGAEKIKVFCLESSESLKPIYRSAEPAIE